MSRTGTSLPYNTEPRWTNERYGSRVAIILGFCLVLAPRIMSQGGITTQSFNGQSSYVLPAGPDSVQGTVINAKTNEPIARAVVYSPDNRYATLTDDRGHFEFKFPPQEKGPPPVRAWSTACQ